MPSPEAKGYFPEPQRAPLALTFLRGLRAQPLSITTPFSILPFRTGRATCD